MVTSTNSNDSRPIFKFFSFMETTILDVISCHGAFFEGAMSAEILSVKKRPHLFVLTPPPVFNIDLLSIELSLLE